MKTYQEYYDEWQLSTESRDLAFDEWLMLQLERQKRQIINKAWEFIEITIIREGHASEDFVEEMNWRFKKAMEE